MGQSCHEITGYNRNQPDKVAAKYRLGKPFYQAKIPAQTKKAPTGIEPV
jgi:hypothetical protein